MFPLFPLTYLWNQVKSVRGKHEEPYKNIMMMSVLDAFIKGKKFCRGLSWWLCCSSLPKKLQK